jgi:hypothetical protein
LLRPLGDIYSQSSSNNPPESYLNIIFLLVGDGTWLGKTIDFFSFGDAGGYGAALFDMKNYDSNLRD